MKIVRQIRGTVHWCRDDQIIWSAGRRIFFSRDGGKTASFQAQLPKAAAPRWKSVTRLAQRLFRQGIIEAVETGEDRILLTVKKGLFEFRLDRPSFKFIGPFPTYPPLRMGWDGKRLIFGDYHLNREREPVRIWVSDNLGRDWHAAYKFDDIRHVHACLHDPMTDRIWITSGDLDHESHLRWTDDLFGSVTTCLTGKQEFRIIDLVFRESDILYGTDTPFERNRLLSFDRARETTTTLQEVDGSVFYMRQVPTGLVCTTAVEASEANKSRDSDVWLSVDGQSWSKIAQFRKDVWPAFLLQFGRTQIPSGPGTPEGIWVSPLATRSDNKSYLIESNCEFGS